MGYTKNINLKLTPEDDTTTTFKEWRSDINGEVDSNMIKIDNEIGRLRKSDLTLSNALRGSACGEVIVLDDVSPITHDIDVNVTVKNIFDISKVESTTGLTNNSDGTLTATGYGKGKTLLKTICPGLKAGHTYTLTLETTGANLIHLSKGDDVKQSWYSGKPLTITEDMLTSTVLFYCKKEDAVLSEAVISNVQIELGTTATEYTPYINQTAVTVKRCSKNILPYPYYFFKGNTTHTQNGITFTDNGDGSITVNGTCTKAFSVYLYNNNSSLLGLKSGVTISISKNLSDEAQKSNVWFSCNYYDSTGTMVGGIAAAKDDISRTGTVTENWAGLGIYLHVPLDSSPVNLVLRPQIEIGGTPTAYEPYVADEYTPDVDGTVDGVTSLYPNTTLTTDAKGAIISVDYNRDINKSAIYDGAALSNRVTAVEKNAATLIGSDKNKSVRTIANEELAAQLIPESAKESLDTLQEIAAWIQSHPDDASAMNEDIAALQNQLSGIDAGECAVKAYIDDAITALNIGDHANIKDGTGEGSLYMNNTSELSEPNDGGTQFPALITSDVPQSNGIGSFAVGIGTKAEGDVSVAEGINTTAGYVRNDGTRNVGSHAEGVHTYAKSSGSHSEGYRTQSLASNSHTEGFANIVESTAWSGHAEGRENVVSGVASHAEGHANVNGIKVFKVVDYPAEDTHTLSSITGLIAGDTVSLIVGDSENSLSLNKNYCSIISIDIDNNTVILSKDDPLSAGYLYQYLYVEGKPLIGDTVIGNFSANSHSEGENTLAAGKSSHAEGNKSAAYGDASHAEGTTSSDGTVTSATKKGAHAEGVGTTASGEGSHSEGGKTIASGNQSHAEGFSTTASGGYSHAEGTRTSANNPASHAEGADTTALGDAAHAEGKFTTASGRYSHAGGYQNEAKNFAGTVIGQYAKKSTKSATKYDSNSEAFVIGNGTSDSSRSNAFEVYFNGTAKLGDKNVATEDYVDGQAGKTIYIDQMGLGYDPYTGSNYSLSTELFDEVCANPRDYRIYRVSDMSSYPCSFQCFPHIIYFYAIESHNNLGDMIATNMGRGEWKRGNAAATWVTFAGAFPCLIEGTNIRMADGSDVAVEDVRAGDIVMSYDPITKEKTNAVVFAAYQTGTSNDFDVYSFENGKYITAYGIEGFYENTAGTIKDIQKVTKTDEIICEDLSYTYFIVKKKYFHHGEKKRRYSLIVSNNLYFANGILLGHSPYKKYWYLTENKPMMLTLPESIKTAWADECDKYNALTDFINTAEYQAEIASSYAALSKANEAIRTYKEKLSASDYKVQKYTEGVLSDEEWAEAKTRRAEWRQAVNDNQELQASAKKAVREIIEKYRNGVTPKSLFEECCARDNALFNTVVGYFHNSES